MQRIMLITMAWMAGGLALPAQGLVLADNNPYLFRNSIENGGTERYRVCDGSGRPIENPRWSVQLWENGVVRGNRLWFRGAHTF